MKLILKSSLLLVFLVCILQETSAQEMSFTKKYKENAIHSLIQLMNDHYVFPEIAKETEKHLLSQLEKGHFDQFTGDSTFAVALTESVQSINKDKHMRIWKNRPYEAPEQSPERMIEERMDQINRRRSGNLGFNTVKVLEGNVGYLDLRGFAGMENGKAVADAYMKLMSNTDAIIIDLSKNGGGSPSMVQYLCSFFFDKKVHLNSLYYREGDRTIDYWTLEDIGGDKMPEVPLYVITSDRTFSGAEEFSYNMQTQKRATLIGQTSGGGANPGGSRGINKNLTVFIPTGKAVNPITKTNWEGVGVIPEVVTTKEEAIDKAHELAKVAAEEYRADVKQKYAKGFMAVHEKVENYSPSDAHDDVLNALKEAIDSEILTEGDINMLGYNYLLEKKKPETSQAIFKANTILFPNSPNVFDSYAESFMMSGDLKASLKYYEKAVEVASANEDRDLDFYKQNVQKVMEMIKKKK